MGKVIYTDNIGFDMSDWKNENIRKVYAGANCIMALTADGRVLQKVTDREFAARTEYWKNITDIAISGCCKGLAIGLVSDGTCMVSKRPLDCFCEKSYDKTRINDVVKSWSNIVEVAASDALFALDKYGKVHYVCIRRGYDDYAKTRNWENVVHIATGSQNSVFGVTADGRVLAAGGNCVGGALGFLKISHLANLKDAVDVCAAGSECESIYIAHKDGTVDDLRNKKVVQGCKNSVGVLKGQFNGALIQKADGRLEVAPYFGCGDYSGFESYKVSSFAVGNTDYGPLFAIAVTE